MMMGGDIKSFLIAIGVMCVIALISAVHEHWASAKGVDDGND